MRDMKSYWPVLDRHNPLTRGIVACHPYQEPGGETVFDVSGYNRHCFRGVDAGDPRFHGLHGLENRCENANQRGVETFLPFANGSLAFTFAWWGHWPLASGDLGVIMVKAASSNSDSLAILYTNFGHLQLRTYNSSGTNVGLKSQSATYLADDTYYRLVATSDGAGTDTGLSLYALREGTSGFGPEKVSANADAAGSITPFDSANQTLEYGTRWGQTSLPGEQFNVLGLMANRCWNQTEAFSWLNDPLQIFDPPRQRRRFQFPGVGGAAPAPSRRIIIT